MKVRDRILLGLLWVAVLTMTTWVGGTLYQMLVIVPLWANSPPQSVRAFLGGTDYNRTIFNFFGPPFMAARNVPLLLALVVGWHRPRHRYALLIAATCFTLFGVVFTLSYVYPINDILFMEAGGDRSAEEVRSLVNRWVFADRVRFAVGMVGFLALLWAFRLPLAADAKSSE
jgi:hypothetical protein